MVDRWIKNSRRPTGRVMFIGEYSHTIDAKGRLIVPSKFREQLGDEFVVTKGLDGCLFVYENSEWKSFEEKLHALPLTNANARKFSRFFLAGACACEVDRQGRILIPSVLREFAHLEKEFNITIPDDQAEKIVTVGDAISYVEANAK